MKLLLLTDSLGLPRNSPEKVEYNDTWVNKLACKFDVHHLGIGGGTINDLYKQIEYVKIFEPDIVIIQSGIVDCAPRALSKLENDFINNFKVLKNISKKFLTNQRLFTIRKRRNLSYTTLNNFKNKIDAFKEYFGEKLYWVGIVHPNNEYENKIPGIKLKVKDYNDLIFKILQNNYINVNFLNSDDIMSDYIHLNKNGHEKLYSKILEILSNRSK